MSMGWAPRLQGSTTGVKKEHFSMAVVKHAEGALCVWLSVSRTWYAFELMFKQ